MDAPKEGLWHRLARRTAQAAKNAAKFIALLALGMAWAVFLLLPWAIRVGLVVAWFFVVLWAMMVWPSYLAPLSPAHVWTVRLMPLALAVLPVAVAARVPGFFWGALALAAGTVFAATWGLERLWPRYAFYVAAAFPLAYLALVFALTLRFRHLSLRKEA